MRFRLAEFSLLAGVLGAHACANGDFSSTGAPASEPQPQAKTEESSQETGGASDDEQASKSAPVSGAYLTCAEESAGGTEISYGCALFNDSSKQKVELASIFKSWQWSGTIPAGKALSNSVKVQEVDTPGAHAIFRFEGVGSLDDVKKVAEETIISLDGELKQPFDAFDGFRKPLNEVLTTPLANPITIGPDADGDRIPDGEDQCSNTPAGAYAHPDGEYVGCAGGQYRDKDL